MGRVRPRLVVSLGCSAPAPGGWHAGPGGGRPAPPACTTRGVPLGPARGDAQHGRGGCGRRGGLARRCQRRMNGTEESRKVKPAQPAERHTFDNVREQGALFQQDVGDPLLDRIGADVGIDVHRA